MKYLKVYLASVFEVATILGFVFLIGSALSGSPTAIYFCSLSTLMGVAGLISTVINRKQNAK